MALDATIGGATADSFGELAAIKARWDDVGYDYSSSNDAEIERAARRGADAIEMYRTRFVGQPSSATQRLYFPAVGSDRDGLSLPDGAIPINVFFAQCEAAFRELITPNCLTPDVVLAGSSGQLKRRKVGQIEREFFQAKDASDIIPTLTSVENLLARYLNPAPEELGEVRIRAIGC